MVFADSRYGVQSKMGKLPEWIKRGISQDCVNLSTDTAIALVKRFAREMGQPWDPAAHIPGDLWGPEHIPKSGQ